MRNVPRVFAAIAALGFAVLSFAAPAGADPLSGLRGDPAVAAIADSLARGIPGLMAQAKIPGCAMAIVGRDGIAWAKGFGVREADGSDPVTAETIFSAQSMSKVVTATAIMIAVQEGLLDLDAPITTYLPSFTVHSRFEEHPERSITLRRLLTHTSGLGHETLVGGNYTVGAVTFEEHVRSISDTWLLFPVGTRCAYSNLGMDLAGYALQAASGMPFAEYVRTRLLEPLGVARGTFDGARIAADTNRAIGQPPGGRALVFERGMIPCGGFYASAPALGALIQLHLSGGMAGSRRLLEERLVDAMRNEPFPFEGQIYGHGLGVFRFNRLGGRTLRTPYPGHSGGGFGFGCHMAWLPEYGVGAVVLTNSANTSFASTLVSRTLAAIVAAKGIEPPSYTPYADLVPLAAVPEGIERLYGTYAQMRDRLVFGERDGVVGFETADGAFFPASFVSPREAFIEIPNTPYRSVIRFVPDDAGAPALLYTVHDGDAYAFAEGPNDAAGPDRPEWSAYEGEYEWLMGSVPIATARIARNNGWLYMNHLKLVEREPGLFFLPSGEAIDLRGAVPVGAGIAGRKKG